MTMWETLFGTPERTAATLSEVVLNGVDFCLMLDALGDDVEAKCRNCIYEYDRYGCEETGATMLEWLRMEVTE